MIDPKKHKEQIDILLTDIEENTERYTMAVNALQRALIAARRIVEKMILSDEIEKKQGKEYFEAKLPPEKKPIKVKGITKKSDNIQKPKV